MLQSFKFLPGTIALCAGFVWLSLAVNAAAQVATEQGPVEPWSERAIFQHVDRYIAGFSARKIWRR